jgi:rhamnosyltransferase
MPKIAIIIRTKNEAKMLGSVLKGIDNQDFIDKEVVIVDSGSTDNTLQIAESWKAKIFKIPPEDFTFGYALNYGAAKTDSEFICYLSGHAVPYNEKWLSTLLEPMQKNERVAGAYSRQIAFPGHNPLERLWLKNTFPLQKQKVQCVFSNASCLIRRSAWEDNKFDELVTGFEDQLWAKNVKEKHNLIEYIPDSIVFHSHNEALGDFCRRTRLMYLPKLQFGLQGPFSIFYLVAEIGQKVLLDFIFLIQEREHVKWFFLSPIYRTAHAITIFKTQKEFRKDRQAK